MSKHIAGKIRTDAAMIQLFAFTTGFHCTVAAPKGLVHVKTALAMDGLFSVAAIAGYAAA